MRSLIMLVATTAVVSGLREIPSGFTVDYRSFGGPSPYREQRLPDRDLSRSFRESPQPSGHHQRPSFREEASREYRQPFSGRDGTSTFHPENRGGFKVDNRGYNDENRETFVDELRSFNGDSRQLRDDARIFKDDVRSFREESGTFREGRTFSDEPRMFRDGPRPFSHNGPFRDNRRPFREEIRPYREDYRTFRDESRPFKEDFRHFESPRNFRDESRPFRDETERFRDGKPYREESGPLKNGLRPFKDESGPFRNEPRPFKEESGPFRNEPRPFKDESGPFRNEPRPFKDESGPFRNEPRPFKDESGPFRNEPRPFKDESEPFRNEPRPFKDESGPFRNEPRPFKDESGPFRNEPRPFKDESGPFRNEPRPFGGESGSFRNDRPFKDDSESLRNELRPFTDDSGSFKDEILFTQESQSLVGAQNHYNKEQEHRQPLSFGGHSNYLKYGNHGLGFASVPAAVLPLEDNSHRGASGITRSELSQTAATQSPGTSSPARVPDTNNQISVTVAPESLSTPSQSPTGNSVNNERKNEKVNSLTDEASTSQASTAVTISTSGGTNVTPKVVFGSGSPSVSNSPMVISNSDGSATSVHQSNTGPNLHASKSSMHSSTSSNSYFPGDATAEVPAALLNYIFKYQQPQETKMRYVYRQSLPSESFNHIQSLSPGHHHQTAKYTFLPEFKIPGLSGIQQPGGTINYVSATGLPKLSYLNGNSPSLTLGTSYSTDAGSSVNFGRNVLQLDQTPQFSHLGQTEQLSQLRPIGQTEQFSQLRQITAPTNLNQLGQYGQFGQVEQTRNNPFNQGGLQLQLGGFGGIDYSAMSSSSEAVRASPAGSLGIPKVGLSFSEPVRPPAPAFTKLSFGETLW